MPNLASAKKSLRKTTKQTARNKRYKNHIKAITKEMKELIANQETEKAHQKLSLFFKAVDKAAKRHIIHKNTASRRKSLMYKNVQSTNTAKNINSQAK